MKQTKSLDSMKSFHFFLLFYYKGIDQEDLVLLLVDNYLDIVVHKDFVDIVVHHMDFVDIVVHRMDIVDYCKDLDNWEHLDMVGLLELVDKYCHNLTVVLVALQI